MFEEITISGFRGINNLKIDDFKRFNLFVGKNNCGKTTVLESIFLLVNPRNAELPVKTNRFRKFEIINEDMWAVLFYRMNLDTPIELLGKLKRNREARSMKIRPKFDYEINSKYQKDLYEADSVDESLFQSGRKQVVKGLILESNFAIDNFKPKNFKTEIFVASTEKGLSLKIEPNIGTEEELKGVFLFPFDPFVQPQVAKRLENVLIQKRKKRIIDVLKKIESGFKDISLGLEHMIYCDIGLEKMIPINALGAGVLKLLNIILAIESTENGIVIIDEIENGLYPISQEIMWDVIFSFAKEFNVQIFAATHSLECIKAYSSVFAKSRQSKDELRAFRIDKTDEKYKVVKFDKENMDVALESGWDFR